MSSSPVCVCVPPNVLIPLIVFVFSFFSEVSRFEMMMQANQRPQQQHTLRKFPQRSQSLRVKSNVIPHRTGGGISGGGGGQSLATSRTSMKLVITNKDLIVQDDSPCGGTLSRQSSLFRNMSRQSVDSNSSTTKPITFFINCSSLPDLNLGQHYLKVWGCTLHSSISC